MVNKLTGESSVRERVPEPFVGPTRGATSVRVEVSMSVSTKAHNYMCTLAIFQVKPIPLFVSSRKLQTGYYSARLGSQDAFFYSDSGRFYCSSVRLAHPQEKFKELM